MSPYAGGASSFRDTPQPQASSDNSDPDGASFQDHLAQHTQSDDSGAPANTPAPAKSSSPDKSATQAKAPATPTTQAKGRDAVAPQVKVPVPLLPPIPPQAKAPAPATPAIREHAKAPAPVATQAKAPAAPKDKASNKPADLKVTLLPGTGLPQFALPIEGLQSLSNETGSAKSNESDGKTTSLESKTPDVPVPARQTVNFVLTPNPAAPVAFAVRVNPAQDKDAHSDSEDRDAIQGPQTLLASREPAMAPVVVSQQQEHKQDSSQDGLPTAMAEVETQKAPQTFSEHLQAADPAKAAEPEPDPKSVPVEPARQIHVQVAGAGSQRVDLRVIERDGTMSVSVRAADPSLSRTLQEHMPELTTRLEAEHFHTETWVPRSSASSSSSFEQGSSDSHAGYSPGGDGSGQQGGRQQDTKPDWVDELESYAGNSQTRRNSLWRQ